MRSQKNTTGERKLIGCAIANRSYMGAWCPRKYIEKFRPDLMKIVDNYEVML